MTSQLELVRVSRETSWHRHRRHPSRRGLARPEHLLFSLKNREQKARASRSHASLSNTVTGQSGMPVQQYDSTAGAGRPTPQQPPIGCGLPGPYGRYRIRESTSADICKVQNVSPRLYEKHTAHGSGSERRWKPEACPSLRTESNTHFTKHAIITACIVRAVVD